MSLKITPFLTFSLLMLLALAPAAYSQSPPISLQVLYSNNQLGELDPCG